MLNVIHKFLSFIWAVRAALVYKQYQPSLEWRDCLSLGSELLTNNSLSTVPSKAAFHDVKSWQ